MKFQDMPYVRPNIEELKQRMQSLTDVLTKANTFEEAHDAFLRHEELESGFGTAYAIAYTRHRINTEDKFYDEENAFFDSALPAYEEAAQPWKMAMLESPFRPEFEEKYGKLLFINSEMELKTFSPEIMGELQQENALCSEYSKLIASAQIPFEGKIYTISQLAPFKTDPNDERRLAAWKAEAGFYKDNQARLDGIYDELTHLRDKMGKKLGYDGYTQMGYYRMQRNCYTKEDIELFRESVVKYLVPVADSIYRHQAERLGKEYPLSFADMALEFRSGNPKPHGTPEEILAHGKKFYHELSPETAEFIDFMYDNELLDVLSKKGKAGGGYCIELNDYKAPFIFANFNGTSHDVEVITHEAGHAFAFYTARDVVPMQLQSPSMESCEVHSMSMEFFSWPWAKGFFGEDTRKFYYTHLSGALTFIPYGTMVDHFQHIVYEKPDMTPAQRHDVWKMLLGIYMPWVKLDGDIPFYSEGQGWQRQMHIYESPFYYIDYCLAQTMALQFWALMQKDRTAAWDTYMKYTRQAGTKTFRDLVETAGLQNPFGKESLREVSNVAAQWLKDYDLSGLE